MDAPPPHLLIVEGNDERHVIEKLLDRHGVDPLGFDIEPKGGFEKLRRSLYNEVNASGRRTLGIIADANDQPDQRWQSISDQLKGASCAVPASLSGGGAIFSGPRGIRVGVWLMPDNDRPGELENFFADLIPDDDCLWSMAKRYIDEIPENRRLFTSQKLTRAYVHAWLATRERPRPMGLAIKAGDLRHDAAVATQFVQWIQNLFDPQAEPSSPGKAR